jgi:hypothetical protein
MKDRVLARTVVRAAGAVPAGAALLIAGALGGCFEAPARSDSGDAPLELEWDILPRVAEGAYAEAGFLKVNGAAYESTVAPGKQIDVWVSIEGLAAFTQVAPELEGSGAELPSGAVIVREVRDGGGALLNLTVMAKAPAGYSPRYGDFWYGVLAPDGWPTVGEDGEPAIGPLVERCASCHFDRAADGFLFGVPAGNRTPLTGMSPH